MRLFVSLCLSLSLVCPALAQTATAPKNPPAASGGGGGDKIIVPDLGDAELDAWLAKSNAAVKLLNEALSISRSYDRYASWADVKKGPTTKERIIYGLYSVHKASIAEAAALGRKSAGSAPSLPGLDQAMIRLADAAEAAAPVINEASTYYERQDYKDDKGAGAKELHAKLIPLYRAAIDARTELDRRHKELKQGLDGLELARLERSEGRSYRWHQRRIVILAEKAVELMPRDPRKPGDLSAFDAAVAAFAAEVKDFDTVVAEGQKSSAFDSQPRGLLGSLREIRDKVGGRAKSSPSFYSFDYNRVVDSYNLMLSLKNLPRT